MSAPPLLRREQQLQAALLTTTDPAQRAALLAEQAWLAARSGRTDAARQAVDAVRRGGVTHPAVAAWLALTEDHLDHLAGLAWWPIDRQRRACALAAALPPPGPRALLAAGLAHAHEQRQELPAALTRLAEAFLHAAPDDHAARGQACRTAARLYQRAGQPAPARRFQAAARAHASAQGDDLVLSGLLHDLAWHQVLGACSARRRGVPVTPLARQALLALASWEHVDQGLGLPAPRAEAALGRALLASAQGDAEAALGHYQQHHDQQRLAQPTGTVHRPAWWQADEAWCLAWVGRADAAHRQAAALAAGLADLAPAQERALARDRLAELWTDADPAAAARQRAQATLDWQQGLEQQDQVLQQLDSALRSIPAAQLWNDPTR